MWQRSNSWCVQVRLTVYFLNVNVIGLRVVYGDLFFNFALSQDESFLKDEREKDGGRIKGEL